MSVKGQSTDAGQGMKSRGNPEHDVDFVEGSSKKKNSAEAAAALRGHNTSNANDGACDASWGAAYKSPTRRGNQPDAHGPNTQLHGSAMPHHPVKTSSGKTYRKAKRQTTPGVDGPNIGFQGGGSDSG